MALLGGVPLGAGFELSEAHSRASLSLSLCLYFLLLSQNLPACHQAPQHDRNELDSNLSEIETVSKPCGAT